MAGHLYRILYRLDPKPEGLTKEQAKAAAEEGFGACDKAILFSIIEPEDGSLSTLILSRDGKTGEELDDFDLFKHWTLFAHRLAQSQTLDEGRRGLATQVFKIVSEALRGEAEEAQGSNDTPTA